MALQPGRRRHVAGDPKIFAVAIVAPLDVKLLTTAVRILDLAALDVEVLTAVRELPNPADRRRRRRPRRGVAHRDDRRGR